MLATRAGSAMRMASEKMAWEVEKCILAKGDGCGVTGQSVGRC